MEFALLLPVFLAFLLGLIEFSRAMWVRQTLQFAVEEATRFALADPSATSTAITARLASRMVGLSGSAITVAVASDTSAVTVTVTHDFQFLVPGLLPYGPIAMSAKSRFPRQ